MTYLIFALGLAGLLFGGDLLVRGAVGLAERFGVPPLVIGLTIVGFGTSTPELLVSVEAALAEQAGIAIGNVIGSNIANILLILGLSAAIGPLAAPFAGLRRDLGWMIGAAVLTVPLFWNGEIGLYEGMVLVAGIAGYLAVCLFGARGAPVPDAAGRPALWKAIVLALLGLGLVMVGARLLVDSATEIARTFGVSEAMIGLTIVAVGTSLPELATSVIAAVQGRRDIAIGNVVGSNIFNILGILGVTALIAPIPVAPRFLALDVWVMLGVSLALTLLLWRAGGVSRLAGLALMAVYAAYVGLTAGI